MAVLAANEVGCDIEILADPDPDIVQNCFSPQEKAYYEVLSPHQQREAFYRIWTAREAFLKAIGRGLCDPVPVFSVLSDDGLFTPILMFEGRTFWGQSTTDDGYAMTWWCEVPN